ncbi:uncharacterized protein [Littorina saxatilis]|uniref:uncharacterized protein n=1 Tax=Littorina saxatilis TaxID=31220 RepID=UPI0038B6820E
MEFNRTHKPSNSLCSVLKVWCLLVVVVLDTVKCYVIPEVPTARIVVHVRKRRAPHWDYWQINSNVCPPSLCGASSEDSLMPAPRPRGTGGSVFYQGDVVLDKELDRYIFPQVNHTRYRRATVRLRNRLWKDGEVPYVLSGSLSAQARRVVLRAFKHISQRTCIIFRERKKSDTDFVKFISEPGCWSSIGRTGGRQLLSLGRGCENIGTAVHEITHALGVWHEQARKDRDKYVRIIEENVSERFLKDFEKVNSLVSTSRGYPYDYTSVMHYSRYAFTKNGKLTIEVIGVGKDLGLTIKQRSGLSTIDKAQLRDMYRCNLHTDTNQTHCPGGWLQHETSCYQFYQHPKKQFAAAARQCEKLNSHLVFIESQREDQFLAEHLLKNFPYDYTWRTGGRRINDMMTWYRKDSTPVEMEHTNWAEGQPVTFSTTALERDRLTNVTQWVGVWAGSMRQLPYYMYPFICERRARRKCLKLRYKDGRDYRGKLDHTMDGYTCQKWTEQYPHQHNLTEPTSNNNDNKEEDKDGLGNHNHCRNPKEHRRSRPWCYTTKKTHEWQFCDITACSTSGSGSSNNRPDKSQTTAKPPRRILAQSGGRRPSSAAAGGRQISSATSSGISGRLGRPSNNAEIQERTSPRRGKLTHREKRRERNRRRRHLQRKERGKNRRNSKRRTSRRQRRKRNKEKKHD